MALTIHQKPLYDLLHSGEKIIYTVKDLQYVTNNVKVKYIARVYVAPKVQDLGLTSNLAANSLIAVLKTNPNSAGVGIFDFGAILDNYVSPDFEGGNANSDGSSAQFSSFKSNTYDQQRHDIHLIDAFCANQNACRYVRIIFNMEGAGSLQGEVIETQNHQTADELVIFNGYLQNTEILNEVSGNFGYNLSYHKYILNDDNDEFLTEAPKIQYIREKDYQTLAFFNNLQNGGTPGSFGVGSSNEVDSIKIQYYYNGATVGSLITNVVTNNGVINNLQTDSNRKLTYFGVGTANQKNNGNPQPSNWDYYTVQAFDGGVAISDIYYFYKQEDDCKGFETIRLCWLNKFGTWDYYNFTKKSIRTFSKEAVSFQSLEGTWNGDKFSMEGYKGGKKIYKSKATEIVILNTDFITDEEAIWLESLFVSNHVYILSQNSNDANNQGTLRKYVEPVFMASSELERQTTANNGKKQYTFSINKSKMRKTHRT